MLNLQLILFLIFGALAVAGGINMLRSRSPIYGALSLILVMGALAVLYLLLGAEFIAFVQILVYAGAIMVLFVFVIMLLNAQPLPPHERARFARRLGLPAIFILLGILAAAFALRYSRARLAAGSPMFHVRSIGQALFHQGLLPFEATSVLFLVGIAGAVLLAARPETQSSGTDTPAVKAADRSGL